MSHKWRLIVLLTIISGHAWAQPTCIAPDPIALVKMAWAQPNHQFDSQDGKKPSPLLAEPLRTLLAKDDKCKVKNGLCIIEADYFTGGQDGAVVGEITHGILAMQDRQARVVSTYAFSLGEKNPPLQKTQFVLTQNKQGCWAIADVIDGSHSHQSLLKLLKK